MILFQSAQFSNPHSNIDSRISEAAALLPLLLAVIFYISDSSMPRELSHFPLLKSKLAHNLSTYLIILSAKTYYIKISLAPSFSKHQDTTSLSSRPVSFQNVLIIYWCQERIYHRLNFASGTYDHTYGNR